MIPSYVGAMPRRLRFVPEGSLVEVTVRPVQGRFLLKPSPGWTETFVGILARAQELYPVRLHAIVCLRPRHRCPRGDLAAGEGQQPMNG